MLSKALRFPINQLFTDKMNISWHNYENKWGNHYENNFWNSKYFYMCTHLFNFATRTSGTEYAWTPTHGAEHLPYPNRYLTSVIHRTCNTHSYAKFHLLFGTKRSQWESTWISPLQPQIYMLVGLCCCYCFNTHVFIAKPRNYHMLLFISVYFLLNIHFA